jgi:hypothetical protein
VLRRRPLRALLAASLFVVIAGAPRVARADEQTDLEKVRAAYLGKNYDEAERRLVAILDPDKGAHDPQVLTQARMYLGAVMLAKGNADGASQVFEKLILDDPTYEPDPLSFPTNAIDLFIDTRARLRERLNAEAQERVRREAERRARAEEKKRKDAERLATLERMAGEERVTERHSRWIAAVPFGAGQFQNGDTAAGWALLGVESALVAGTLVCLPIYLTDLQYRTEAFSAGDRTRAQEYIDRANAVRVVNLSLAGAFAAVAIVGVVQAQAAFVPERTDVKKRVIPPTAWQPILAPSGDARGGIVGIGGTF